LLESLILGSSMLGLFLSFVFIALVLYFLYAMLDYAESFLGSAKWISVAERVLGTDTFLNRLHRVNMLCVCLKLSGLLAKRGEIDMEEVKSIPRNVRRFIRLIYSVSVTSGLCMVFSYCLSNWSSRS
jgi:hypothetical protein